MKIYVNDSTKGERGEIKVFSCPTNLQQLVKVLIYSEFNKSQKHVAIAGATTNCIVTKCTKWDNTNNESKEVINLNPYVVYM